ncbi:MAG TPA: hypothetical protein VKZ53_30045 [Candidatus Angelobacter sp.]|nr:hypothetical protein [Candidatus Angelobacter sp.]
MKFNNTSVLRGVLFLPCLLMLAQPAVFGQSQPTSIESNIVSGVSCAPSQNGTGHIVCGAQTNEPALSGFSWQAVPNIPPIPTSGAFGAPIEAANAFHMTNTPLPTGPFINTPGCTSTADGSGSVICAFQEPNGGGLYGTVIHPQPAGNAPANLISSPIMPLIVPGTLLPAQAG